MSSPDQPPPAAQPVAPAPAPVEEKDEKVRVLLLGAGGSGKSTLFKQFKNIYGAGLPEDERELLKDSIYINVIQGIKVLVAQSDTYGPIAPELAESRAAVEALRNEGPIDEAVGAHIKALWADAGIQTTFQKRTQYNFFDSEDYYFSRLDDIMKADYIPTHQDCLRCRVSTTGIVTETYSIDGTIFSVTDVGGQRSERKRWANCLKNLDAVCFVCSLSAYTRTLYEDADVNRLQEAMDLFEVICNSDWFESVSKFVFLNKADLFRDILPEIPLNTFFKQYEGANEFEPCVEFLKEQFNERNYADSELNIYVTCATDADNIKEVFGTCKDKMLADIAKNRVTRRNKPAPSANDDTATKIKDIAKKKNK
jgi:GTPase SAR1 family protein